MSLKSTFNKVLFKLKKNMPDILIVLGIAGIGYGIYDACKSTIKAQPILEEHKIKREEIEEKYQTNGNLLPAVVEEKNREITNLYFGTGKELVKLYARPTIVVVTSIASLIGSHKILKDRYTSSLEKIQSLGAAYTTLSSCYNSYRENVREKYGEDVDDEMAYNAKVSKTKEGKVMKLEDSKKNRFGSASPWCVLFDEKSKYYEKHFDYNNSFIREAENKVNQRVRNFGYIYMNEIYDLLGFGPEERTEEGQSVGFIYKPDRVIQFKIKPVTLIDDEGRPHVEPTFLIDFNPDGVILGLAPMRKLGE